MALVDPELSFAVEEWNAGGSVLRVHARAARLDVSFAAYQAVIAAMPDRAITLRQGIRVIRDSTRPDY